MLGPMTMLARTCIAALASTGFMAWFSFGPKRVHQGEMDDGVQVVRVRVQGGYSPDVIQVTRGFPVRVAFDRQ